MSEPLTGGWLSGKVMAMRAKLAMSTTRTPVGRISVSTLAAILAMCLACALAHGVCAEFEEELIQKLNSPHQKVRVEAASSLPTNLAVRAAVPGLVKMLDDRTPLVWVSETRPHGKNAEEFESASSGEPSTSPATEAAVALGRIRDHRATKPLMKLFRTGVSYERIAAVRAIARIEGDNCLNVLTVGLQDSSTDVVSEARSSMHDVIVAGSAEHPLNLTATRRVLSLLENRQAAVRASAAEILGNLHEPLAVPPLIKLAHQRDPAVVGAAAFIALTRIQEFRAPPLPWLSVILGAAALLVALFFIGAVIYGLVRREKFDRDAFWILVVITVIGFFGYAGIRSFNDCRSLEVASSRHDVVALVKNAYSCNESYPGDNRAAFILVEIGNEKVIKVMGNDARGTDRHKRTVAQWVLARVIAKNEGSKLEHMANSRDPEVKKTVAWLLKKMDDSRRK